MHNSKICYKCEKLLPLTEFNKRSVSFDGLAGRCKQCVKINSSAYRERHIERLRAYDRGRSKSPARLRLAAKYTRIWRDNDPRRYLCHNEVRKAVRNGVLIKQPCSVCGSEKSMAHHESYDRPLEVIWFCQPHHRARHREMVAIGIKT